MMSRSKTRQESPGDAVRGWTARLATALTLTCVAMVGCVDESGPPPVPETLSITSAPPEPMAVGDTVQLAVEVLDQYGRPLGGSAVAWVSDDPSVTSVSASGVVRAVGAGTATVTAHAGGATGSIQLSVADPEYWVLVAFYSSTGGDDWTNNDGWGESPSLADWYGVDVDSIGRVLSLRLPTNNLTGRIPPEVGDLAHLEELDLSGNEIGGAIPPEVGELANLKDLDLSGNELKGSIPKELGDLAELELLDLATNEFEGPIPPELGNAAALVELWLRNNDLDGPIPPELGDLENLEVLDLRSSGLTGAIPPELSELPELRFLNLSDNELSGQIPPALGNLAGLVELWLGHNELAGPIPPELGELESLRVLWASHNALSGAVPAELGGLGNLTVLLIGDNSLSGPLPIALAQLPLESLGYADTELCVPAHVAFREWLDGIPVHEGTGIDCTPVEDRAVLEALYRATDGDNWANNDNWLTDVGIGEWYGVTADTTGRVVSLSLRANELNGTIPPELANLVSLEDLIMSDNGLGGEIPPALGGLASLVDLDLSRNDLTGPIPPQLGDLPKLEYLRLTANDLVGPLPVELGFLTRLRWLELGSNRITGAVPPALGNLADLERLDLSENDLSGSIPPNLGKLAQLTYLSFRDIPGDDRDNELTGPIPTELGNLDSLGTLNVSGNSLTGSIPPELGDLGKLTRLILASNELTGAIPPELGNLQDLSNLDVSSNTLTESIPREIGNLANLTYLGLSSNDLTGPVPPELGRLANLEVLALSDNDLVGELPSELGELSGLRWMWISQNEGLAGPLPLSLVNVPLEHLQYSGTSLCVPEDEALRQWLKGLERHEGTGVDCLVDRGILESSYNAMDGPNWVDSEHWLTDKPVGEWFGVQTDSTGRVARLALPGNAVTGPIAPELGNLAMLNALLLNENDLTGEMPPELGNLDKLESLRVHDNDSLTGALPLSLSGVPLAEFWYHNTDLCVPSDIAFRQWLADIDDHRGTGVDCGAVNFRLEFDSLAEVSDWARVPPTTVVEVSDGVLSLASSVAGQTGSISDLDLFETTFDAPLTDWVATARMARSDTDARMAFWLETTHARWESFRLDLGSGLELGPDTAMVDTNWRIFLWDAAQGRWVYFHHYGYGTSDAIRDGVGEFTDMSFRVTEDSIWIHADSTLVFAEALLPVLVGAGAMIKGVGLSYRPLDDTSQEGALFDWFNVTGRTVEGADAHTSRIGPSGELKIGATVGTARPVSRRRIGR